MSRPLSTWLFGVVVALGLLPALRRLARLLTEKLQQPSQPHAVKIAYVGNSIIYYNDMPRLVEALCTDRAEQFLHDSCASRRLPIEQRNLDLNLR